MRAFHLHNFIAKFVCLPFAMLIIMCASQTVQASLIEAQTIKPDTTEGLQALFQTMDYSWNKLEEGVPPIILESIPRDISHAVSTKEKKRSFFMGLLPMVLIANDEILKERNEFIEIIARHKARKPKPNDKERLEQIAKRYGLRGRPLIDHRARTILLRRIDIIPPSLALAQAANESAWGTSRFARLGNNIFGEWTYKPGTGIIPEGRPEGATYEVRKFSSIYASIRSYMNNLNRNGAYRKLQEIRANLRSANKPITGTELALGLSSYSQRGEEYIKEIQAMIRQNQLETINTATLRRPDAKSEALTKISTTGAGLFSSRNRIIGHKHSTGPHP